MEHFIICQGCSDNLSKIVKLNNKLVGTFKKGLSRTNVNSMSAALDGSFFIQKCRMIFRLYEELEVHAA